MTVVEKLEEESGKKLKWIKDQTVIGQRLEEENSVKVQKA